MRLAGSDCERPHQVVGSYSSNDGLPLNFFPERSTMVILESHSEKSEKNQERMPGVGR